jgi:hypothetical protein
MRKPGLIRDVAIAGELMRERAHVTRALHVVLTAQRIHAHTFAAQVAGRHRQVGDAHHHRRALAVLGDAESVVDRGVACARIQASGSAHLLGGNARDARGCFRRAVRMGNERLPLLIRGQLAALGDERFTRQAFGHDHVRHCIHQGHVRSRAQLQVIVGLYVRGTHELNGARIGDDQMRAFTQTTLQLRGKDGMAFGGIGADQQNHVGLHHGRERLRAGGLTQRLLQAVARRRMADAGTRIDIVVAEGGAHHLLHEVRFFVGAA